jgi:hypothetical protein
MPHDIFPDADPDFHVFMLSKVPYIVANAVALGLAPAQSGGLNSLYSVWATAYPAHNTAQSAAQSATAAKETARESLELAFREAVGIIQKHPGVTNAQRQSAGVPVHDVIRTPTAAIATRPVLMVNTAQRLQHTIKWADEATPTSRARPAGALGLELFCKVGGPAPVSTEGCEALGLITNSPNVEDFDAAQANQTVYYVARWVNKRGARGPLSVVVNATITG